MNLLANSEWLWAVSLFISVQFKGDSYVKNPFMDRFCEFCYQALNFIISAVKVVISICKSLGTES